MGRTEGVGRAQVAKSAGDPILDWFAHAGEGVHRLMDRPPYHRNCRCRVRVVAARGGQREVTKTIRSGNGPCEQCVAREQIWLWLADNGRLGTEVARLAGRVDVASFVRIYSHLKRLCERFPQALPQDGIRLTFGFSMRLHDFGMWDERPRTLNLSGEYFGDAASLAVLRPVLAGLEARGDSPKGCNEPEYIVTHEFAHCLRRRLDTSRYGAWWSSHNQRQVCENALANPSEGFAEGFATLIHAERNRWSPAAQGLQTMLREDGISI